MRQEIRIAIGRSGFERLCGYLATGTGFVFHHHRHAELVFELIGQDAGNCVGAAAWRKANQHFDRAALSPYHGSQTQDYPGQ